MSNVKTNQFGEGLLFILGEFAVVDGELLEDGCMEVYGEDDQGREGSCEVEVNELAQAAIDEIRHLQSQLAKANERIKELEQNQPPIENGKNRYGLDVSYFRNVINRELNRPLENYKPDELARVFARLSRTADKSVMFEPEFSNKFAIGQKCESASELNTYFVNRANREGEMLPIYFPDWCNDFREQLRKEQE